MSEFASIALHIMLYERLADELAALIAKGPLRPGDRLPSIRRLAEQKRLSISTVVQALRQLEDRGWVEARPKAGYFVGSPSIPLPEPQPAAIDYQPTDVAVTQRLLAVLRANDSRDFVPFGNACPAPELLPVARILRLYGRVARHYPKLLTDAGNTWTHNNLPALTRQIVKHSMEWGKVLDPAEITVTNSCAEAINLCLRVVTEPGDTVAVESPTHFVFLQILENLGLKALEIPCHAQHGLSVEALALATRLDAVRACLLIPNANNPLGTTIPEDHKRRIVRLLAERNIPLIEDDISGDLHFEGPRPPPLKAFDETGNVMLCSSLSKALSSGIRVGFVAAGRHKNAVDLQKALLNGITNPISQMVVAEFMESGGYDRHLRALRRALARQVQCVSAAIAEHFPEGCRISRPKGGYVLWVELPERCDASVLHREAIAAGIAFTPGELFSASGLYRHYLRVSCGYPWDARMAAGIEKLGRLLARQRFDERAPGDGYRHSPTEPGWQR
ncbi:MAG: PLP-dependent aminotransferase family protein [Candidatus Competibacteraceae bacterium]|nr:PLP-dependent aminotransferase family protein [Candidatus Competibacteraceae bacterium]